MPEDESVESLGRIRSNVSDASGWTNETHVSDAYEYRPAKAGRALLVALLTGATWLLYTFLNFSDKVHAETWSAGAILDTAYVPQRDHDIIISMYKEPTEHVASLISGLRDIPGLSNAHVLIYIKDAEADLEVIERGTGADEVTSLPNLGREGETYLNHIVNRWDNLARQTFFLQADVHNPREFWPRITDYFDPVRTGMLSLGWSGNVCNCYECGDKWDVRDPTGLFPKVYGQINNSTSCDQVLLSYKGQFVVSAQRIRGVKKSVYEDLRDALVNPDSWAHQETYLQGRPDSLNAPQFGFQLERMWNLLFQCSDLDVAFKCPSLLSGSGIGTGRIGGSKEDCQCLDPAR
ncbi:hypothetical protein BU24DRAFT_354629 [Aaosphaeria arxii CBS 175.79]|uniref:Uncharacterized protein n=1 Tax=Aaosphaeria arxii CBS 175.79 TaxID=1450172 RepID=A0A6A5XFN9_9PLEO|nr:uncharacterized protein BU24DRAFT_354629 [Aaosphaeria arxii CBS 175.79]KAF2011679.1 hypothetical protein BU24DRAFT_354629 [Aaosphaeria arxii CBS 175.79]